MSRIDTPALVMKTAAYRESSLIVSLFTRDHGRLSAVAKGYRSGKRKQRVEPFVVADVGLSGRSALLNITRFEPAQQISLPGELLASGFYVLELLSRSLAERQVEPRIFRAALAVLTSLSSVATGIQLRMFERLLLEELGFGIDYLHDGQRGHEISDEAEYDYVDEVGLVQVPGNGITGSHLKKICNNDITEPEVLRSARRLNQAALRALIGHEPIMSRTLLTGQTENNE